MISGYIQTSISYDTDAEAFFTAAGITDVGQKNAVNDLVLSLKADSLWTKMVALYPFIGGSASTHAVNLKSPGTYDITWYGGVTHNSNGITPNGTTGYGNTGINPSTVLNTNEGSMGFYSRTTLSGVVVHHLMGALEFFPLKGFDFGYFDTFYYYRTNADTSGFKTTSPELGLHQTYRTSSTTNKLLVNSTSDSITRSYTSPNQIVMIGARGENGTVTQYNSINCAFAYVGNSITDTDAANFNTHITTYQTALSRNV
jgi:hypothetical protein